jgi:hypothetical protein
LPNLTLADGTSLTWGETTPEPAPATDAGGELVTATIAETAPPAAEPVVTSEDVSAALARVPPKWVATGWRFLKTLGAALAAAFVVTGGTVEGIVKDPTAFATALIAAVLMAVQKFLSWKE